MSDESMLEDLFVNYLTSGLEPKAAPDLPAALHRAGLDVEGTALEAYWRAHGPVELKFSTLSWRGRRCFAGPLLPQQAKPGDLWFDVVELTPSILIAPPGSQDPKSWRWISLHPVYLWQFRAFVHVAEWQEVQQHFQNAPDLLSARRFVGLDGLAYATDLYHEEAVAYAHWFGKFLVRRFDLLVASQSITPSDFAALLPTGLKLWDEMEVSQSEFARIAVGRSTFDKDPDEDFGRWEAEEERPEHERMIFSEWERRPDIGLMTVVLMQLGLLEETPRMAYEFVKLHNAAPRKSPFA